MTNLAKRRCIPCEEGIAPLEGSNLDSLSDDLGGGWQIVNEHHLQKDFTFKDFKSALDFTNNIGALAEEEGHHPDIHLSWGKVKVVLWTHKINGLSESDFILAAKIDQLFS
jgi:4a-hydroxytetrahydrobiopterin dehydratase